jgi:hypothetical protein
MHTGKHRFRIALVALVSVLLLTGTLPPLAPAAVVADGPTVTYTYDEAGRLVDADYGGVHIIYVYDDAGNLTARRVELDVYLPLVLRNYS